MIREVSEEEFLKHYGTPRKSGRYPWGSGEDPQAARDFLGTVAELKKKGLSEKEIAEGFDMSINRMRALQSIEGNRQRQERIREAQMLKDKGMSTSAIGRQMGANESTIRGLLAPGAADKADILQSTADMLRRQVDEKGMIDIGSGVELELLHQGGARSRVRLLASGRDVLGAQRARRAHGVGGLHRGDGRERGHAHGTGLAR